MYDVMIRIRPEELQILKWIQEDQHLAYKYIIETALFRAFPEYYKRSLKEHNEKYGVKHESN